MLIEKVKVLRNLRVLYMEDDKALRNTLVQVLKELFLEVHPVENGEQGVKLFQEYTNSKISIDLVLSDINMPNMDGLEAVRLIRQINENTPVVFITGYTSPEYLLKAINLDVSQYIVKPVDANDLVNKLYKAYLPTHLHKMLENKNKELMELNKKIIETSKNEALKYIHNESDYFHFEQHIDNIDLDE